jgi:hypothetical protein
MLQQNYFIIELILFFLVFEQLKNMAYPKFLPCTRSWLQGLGLSFYNVPVVLIFFAFRRYYLFYGIPLFLINNQLRKIIFVFLGLLIYWLSYSYLYHFFWGKDDPHPQHLKWLPSNYSMVEGFYRALFSIIAYVITVGLILPFHDFYYLHRDKFTTIMTIIWIVVASYCFHFRRLLTKNKI